MSLRLNGRPLPSASASGVSWERVQSQAHRPEIQVLIRRAITAGSIRVLPGPDGSLRIIPTSGHQPDGR